MKRFLGALNADNASLAFFVASMATFFTALDQKPPNYGQAFAAGLGLVAAFLPKVQKKLGWLIGLQPPLDPPPAKP